MPGHIEYGTDCCGCGACEAACPKHAVSMREDKLGFCFPEVDEKLCVNCGTCIRVCGYHNIRQHSEENTYAAVSSTERPEESASGGISAALAAEIVKSGGIVYGCAMEIQEQMSIIHHVRISDPEELPRIKGSKYVQSNIRSIFWSIRHDLEAQGDVLLIGTPCQVAAVRGYLKKQYPNFYTADIVCHGVPSAKIFHEFISFLEQTAGKRLIDFKFRDKSEGWKLFARLTYQDKGGNITEVREEPEELSYYQMFLNSYIYRENCYSCPYASKDRPGDITLGDYWGIELVHPELLQSQGGEIDESKGVSCLVINNEQGHHLLEQYGKGIRIWKSTYDQASRYNQQLLHPSERPQEREEVLALLQQGYEATETWYQKRLKVVKAKRKLRQMVPKGIKRMVRKIISH